MRAAIGLAKIIFRLLLYFKATNAIMKENVTFSRKKADKILSDNITLFVDINKCYQLIKHVIC
jgi:hypothetical protein